MNAAIIGVGSSDYSSASGRTEEQLAIEAIRAALADAGVDEQVVDGVDRQVRDRQPTIEQTMLHEVKMTEVRRAIDALPAKQRAAVLMHKYEELEYAQIAQALNCSESAVKSLLFRAYESLRSRLAHMAG